MYMRNDSSSFWCMYHTKCDGPLLLLLSPKSLDVWGDSAQSVDSIDDTVALNKLGAVDQNFGYWKRKVPHLAVVNLGSHTWGINNWSGRHCQLGRWHDTCIIYLVVQCLVSAPTGHNQRLSPLICPTFWVFHGWVGWGWNSWRRRWVSRVSSALASVAWTPGEEKFNLFQDKSLCSAFIGKAHKT